MSYPKFRYISFYNGSSGATIYPKILSSDGKTLWNSRSNLNTYWLLNEGETKVVDCNGDLNERGNKIGGTGQGNSFASGQLIMFGCDTVFGDDDWSHDVFQYDENSKGMISGKKYGGLRDGDWEYLGWKERN